MPILKISFYYLSMRKIGQLECLEVNHSLEDGKDRPWVILFHGYGADAGDLFGLYDYLARDSHGINAKNFNFLCPNGIMGSAFGGRAWWSIDIERLQRMTAAGSFEEMSNSKPASLDGLSSTIFTALEKAHIPIDQVVFGGFSQGAMLATHLFLTSQKAPLGLIAFSGALINREEWQNIGKQRQGHRVFQSHGMMDPVLNYEQAKQLSKLFSQCGIKGELSSFKGGHEIPLPIIERARIYIHNCLTIKT